MAIQQRLPTGDDSVQWDRSAGGDNYALVDDPIGTPDDNSTYNYIDSATVARDYFSFTAFSIPVGSTINSVKVKNRAKRSVADLSFQRLILKVDGITYDGDEFSPALTWTDYFHTWTNNPDTSLPWTVADVNGTGDNPLQTFGYKHELESISTAYCTQVYLEVDYTVPIKLLAGITEIESTATGQIKAIRGLAGITACATVVIGNIKAIRSISRTTRCKSRVTGELSVEELKILAGTSIISSTVTGELSRTREIAGIVAIESTVIGELESPVRELSGTVAIESTTAGILKIIRELVGTCAIACTVTGNIITVYGLSDYAENKNLEHLVGKTPFTMPTAYMALSTTDPTEDGSGITEPSDGYGRVTTTGDDWNNAVDGEIDNAEPITFPKASGDWGTIAYYALFDAPTGGNMLVYDALDISKAVYTAEVVQFAAGELTLVLD